MTARLDLQAAVGQTDRQTDVYFLDKCLEFRALVSNPPSDTDGSARTLDARPVSWVLIPNSPLVFPRGMFLCLLEERGMVCFPDEDTNMSHSC